MHSHLLYFSATFVFGVFEKSNFGILLSQVTFENCLKTVMDKFQVYHANGCGFAFYFHAICYCFHNLVTACTFQFVGPVFLYFFKNFPNFCFGGYV